MQHFVAQETNTATRAESSKIHGVLTRASNLAAADGRDKLHVATELQEYVRQHFSQDISASEWLQAVDMGAGRKFLDILNPLAGQFPDEVFCPLAEQLLQAAARMYHPGPAVLAQLPQQDVTRCKHVMVQECKHNGTLMNIAGSLEQASSFFRGPVEVSENFLTAGCVCAKPVVPGQPTELHRLQGIASLLKLFHAINIMWPGQAGVLTTKDPSEGRKAAAAAFEAAVVLLEQAAVLVNSSHSSEAAACAQESVAIAVATASLLTVQMSRRLQCASEVEWSAFHDEKEQLMTPAFMHLLLLLAGIRLQSDYSASEPVSEQHGTSETAIPATSCGSTSSVTTFLAQYHTQLLKSFGGLSEQLYDTAATAAAADCATGLSAALDLLIEGSKWLAGRAHPCRDDDPRYFRNDARDFVSCHLLGPLVPNLLCLAHDSLQAYNWVQAESALRMVHISSACWNYCCDSSLTRYPASDSAKQLHTRFVNQQECVRAQLLQQLALSLQDIARAAAGAAGSDGPAAKGLNSNSKNLSRQLATKGHYGLPAAFKDPASYVEPEQSDAFSLFVLVDTLLGLTLEAASLISTREFWSLKTASTDGPSSQPEVLSAVQLQFMFLTAVEQSARALSRAAAAAGEDWPKQSGRHLSGVLRTPVCAPVDAHCDRPASIVRESARLAAAATARSVLTTAAGVGTAAASPQVGAPGASQQGLAECSTLSQGPPLSTHQKQLFALLCSLLKVDDRVYQVHGSTLGVGQWAQRVAAAALDAIISSQQRQLLLHGGTAGTGADAETAVPAAAVPWLSILARHNAAEVKRLGQLIPADPTDDSKAASAPYVEDMLAEAAASPGSNFYDIERKHLWKKLASLLASDIGGKYKEFSKAFVSQGAFSAVLLCSKLVAHTDAGPVQQKLSLAASTSAPDSHTVAALLQQKLLGLCQQWEEQLLPQLQHAKEIFAYVASQDRSRSRQYSTHPWRREAANPAAKPMHEPAATVAGNLAAADSPAAKWQVVKDSFIAALPQQVEEAVLELSALLPLPLCCNNLSCINVSNESELQLVAGKGCVCAGCEVARYCNQDCQAAHRQAHEPVCRMIKKSKAAAVDHSLTRDQQ